MTTTVAISIEITQPGCVSAVADALAAIVETVDNAGGPFCISDQVDGADWSMTVTRPSALDALAAMADLTTDTTTEDDDQMTEDDDQMAETVTAPTAALRPGDKIATGAGRITYRQYQSDTEEQTLTVAAITSTDNIPPADRLYRITWEEGGFMFCGRADHEIIDEEAKR